MISIKQNSIIFLLGAGSSIDAGILASYQMISKVEELITSDNENWNRFKDLYYYVKSAILYADGIQGDFSNNINIERLVGVLRDIKKKERNPIYPFIGAWNEKLLELAGTRFDNINAFDKLLSQQIITWVTLERDTQRRIKYYEKFYDFQKSIETPLRIFTLNYDLCIEKSKPDEYHLECGFDEQNKWAADRFTEPSIPTGMYLYKLHGSIDWIRNKDEGNVLERYDAPQPNAELIFGTNEKLQSIDPFLFNVYEFRNYSLISDLIVIIGYSFNDAYINALLAQALDNRKSRRLLVVDINPNLKAEDITKKLKNKSQVSDQIVIVGKTAKQFLETDLTLANMRQFISDEDDVFK